MSTLGKAVISFAADTATFLGDVGKAAAAFEREVGRMQKAISNLDGPLAKLAAGFSIAGVGLFVKSVIDSANELANLRDKTGIAVDKLSELKLAYELGDGAQENFARGLKDFNIALVAAGDGSSKAAKLFKAMGVDIKAGPYEAFKQFAEAFSKLPDDELRAAAAQEVLKRGGADWIPVLAQGAEGLEVAAQKARNLGLVIDEDFARQSEKFNNNMKLIQKSTVGFVNALLAGGALDVFGKIAENIEKSAEKGEKWTGILREVQKIWLTMAAQNPMLAGPLGGLPGVSSVISTLASNKADELFQQSEARQTVTGKIRYTGGAQAAGPDADAVRAAIAQNEAEIRRYISALSGLEKQLDSLNGKSEEERTLAEVFGRDITDSDGRVQHLEGSLEKLTAAHKVNLLNMSLEIDRRKQLRDVIEANLVTHQADVALIEKSQEAYTEFLIANSDLNKEMQFQFSTLLLTDREQEKANALHAIDLDLIRRRRELAKALGDDSEKFAAANANLEAEAEKQRARVITQIETRQRAERDWTTGSIKAFQAYGESATNAAEQAQFFFGNTFRNLEDLLVTFVTKGKANFRDFTNAVVADLARIAIRQAITGPLAQQGAGALGALFGGLGSGGGSTAATSGAAAPAAAGAGDAFLIGLANGGVMTSRGSMRLSSYASGGIANSPQLAVFGEGRTPEAFVPLPDGRRIPVNIQGGAGRGGSVNYIDARGADAAGLAQLADMIRRIDGSLEHRAISAVAMTRGRGGSLSRRIGRGAR